MGLLRPDQSLEQQPATVPFEQEQKLPLEEGIRLARERLVIFANGGPELLKILQELLDDFEAAKASPDEVMNSELLSSEGIGRLLLADYEHALRLANENVSADPQTFKTLMALADDLYLIYEQHIANFAAEPVHTLKSSTRELLDHTHSRVVRVAYVCWYKIKKQLIGTPSDVSQKAA